MLICMRRRKGGEVATGRGRFSSAYTRRESNRYVIFRWVWLEATGGVEGGCVTHITKPLRVPVLAIFCQESDSTNFPVLIGFLYSGLFGYVIVFVRFRFYFFPSYY